MGFERKFILQKGGRDSKEKSEKIEKDISDLINEFPHVFPEGLGQCTKTVVRFELKDNIRAVFKCNTAAVMVNYFITRFGLAACFSLNC